MNDTQCHFYNGQLQRCNLIDGKRCDGYAGICTFYKSDRTFWDDYNESIRKCREKGLCGKCKYTKFPCEEVNIKRD